MGDFSLGNENDVMKAACLRCGREFEDKEPIVCHERVVRVKDGKVVVTEMYHRVCEPLTQDEIMKGAC